MGMSNCCSAKVINERCQDCFEPCEEVEAEEVDEDTKDEYNRNVEILNNGGQVKATDFARSMGINVINF